MRYLHCYNALELRLSCTNPPICFSVYVETWTLIQVITRISLTGPEALCIYDECDLMINTLLHHYTFSFLILLVYCHMPLTHTLNHTMVLSFKIFVSSITRITRRKKAVCYNTRRFSLTHGIHIFLICVASDIFSVCIVRTDIWVWTRSSIICKSDVNATHAAG